MEVIILSNKSTFKKIIIIVITALICLTLTAVIALLFGSVNTEIFDFSNLNLSNMIPIIVLGIFISCVIVGILVLFLAKDVFEKIKDVFFKNDNGGNNK